ncbi:MAG: ATP synthase F1 subunit delta [Thermoguttaceae bacterium]|nr:ATP synthase F1 subunit delta [Thermoguttaceae bacterium]MDW8039394.1 ATP synthase F1 subunit delta [Thermoguttaceae bacterium]
MSQFECLPEPLRQATSWQQEVTVEHIADVYAQAILAAADGEGLAQTVLEEFDSLVEDLLDRCPLWEEVLSSPRIPPEEKIAMLERIFHARASRVFLESLKTLARRGRLDLLRPIQKRLRHLWQQRQHQIQVQVYSAVPLEPAELEQIRLALRKKLAAEPILVPQVDPQLIGGLVFRIGDVIYDASIAHQLDWLRHRILKQMEQKVSSPQEPPSSAKSF